MLLRGAEGEGSPSVRTLPCEERVLCNRVEYAMIIGMFLTLLLPKGAVGPEAGP